MASARASVQRPEELKALMEKFAEKCRIIDNIGDFKHVVTVRRNNTDLAYKFQIGDSYPQTTPNIVIKSSQLSDHDKAELTRYLQQAATGTPIASLVQLADDWLKTQDLEYVFIEAEQSEKKSPKKGKKKQKAKPVKDEDGLNEKKCPMKTAEEVIKRIQWDSALSQEDFTVGYIDRFIGIVEKGFVAFSWEDIASLDYDELAIPQHRIQYFKYKSQVVWDKSKRLDDFFGSTGSKTTILDVIQNYSEVQAPAPKQSPLLGEDSDSDNEEDVVVHTGFSAESLPNKPSEAGEKDANNSGEHARKEEEAAAAATVDNFDGVRAREKYWGPKRRPTHFLCLRITDPEIRHMAKMVHDTIHALEPEFANSFIPVERLHITLACVGLDTQEDVNRASRTLHDLEATLQEMNPQQINVELDGIGNFFDNVLYAKVAEDEAFMNFVELLQSLLLAADIEIRDVFDFHPHMTLLKFKKAAIKEKRTRCVLDSRIYGAVGNPRFGKHAVSNIHLCVMSEPSVTGSFYTTPAKITFSDSDDKA